EEKLKGLPVDEKIEELLDEHFQINHDQSNNEMLEFVIRFNDFEDVIALSKRPGLEMLNTRLYSLDHKYYLYVEFHDELFKEEEVGDILSILLEYGADSSVTIHRLEEYGNKIIGKDVFNIVNKHFS